LKQRRSNKPALINAEKVVSMPVGTVRLLRITVKKQQTDVTTVAGRVKPFILRTTLQIPVSAPLSTCKTPCHELDRRLASSLHRVPDFLVHACFISAPK
jgi:hypothetical protein